MTTEDTRTTGLGVVVQKLRAQEEENQRLRETPSIDDCLRELRDIFRGKPIFIRRNDDFYPQDCRDAAETVRGVTIKIGYLETDPKFKGRTVSECMAQVRSWKQEQEK